MLRLLPYLVALCVLMLGAVAESNAQEKDVPTELLALEDLYQEKVEEAAASLRANFIKSLEPLEKRLAKGRELDQALYVREQRVQMSLDTASEPPLVVAADHAEYAKVVALYRKHRELRVRPLRESYITALAKMERDLVKKNELAAALTVKAKSDAMIKERELAAGRKPSASPFGAKENAKLVIWNQHNAHHKDRGSKTASIALFRGEDRIWRKRKVELEWDREGEEASTSIDLPVDDLEDLRIEIELLEWYGRGGGFAEIEVLRSGKNIAKRAKISATASLAGSNGRVENLVDGDHTSTVYGTYWLAADSAGSVVTLDFAR